MKLPFRLDCRSTYPFFETIAAFDCKEAAVAYGEQCSTANQQLEYRLVHGRAIIWNSRKRGEMRA